jgi:hypothetical protein
MSGPIAASLGVLLDQGPDALEDTALEYEREALESTGTEEFVRRHYLRAMASACRSLAAASKVAVG